MKRLLIENYYKFLETHTKFFKYPLLNLDRYGFSEIDNEFLWKMDIKPKEYIRKALEIRDITKGHIIFRYTTHTYGERAIEIWYNKDILDKYGNKMKWNGKEWVANEKS